VVAHITQVRMAWVKAVAAQQSLVYAEQVNDAAQASAELARRMQSAGNFSKLQRARQQAFYADAATQWATAQHTANATREALVRLLGLTDSQAPTLALPKRLPDLPQAPRTPEATSRAASTGRLDLQLAQAEFESAATAQGLNRITSLTDIELGVRRDSVFDNGAGHTNTRRGFEVSVRLPVFDSGGLQRDAMNARTLASANRLEATARAAGSHLRESYSAYRTAFDVARHYRDEVVPLRQTIAEENVLRYNGMLIGVFELLADTRDQVGSVIAAIAAEQQFWLADAALQTALIGQPTAAPMSAMPTPSSAGGAAH
jgi:outer membrane protein TolC